jgi:hypothetical protein
MPASTVFTLASRNRAPGARMQTSIFLAKLLGPVLLLVGISVALNGKTFRAMAAEIVKSVTLVYLFGIMDFAAGLAIVLVHNVWAPHWYVLITLLGWLLLIRGIVRTVATEKVMGYAARISGKTELYTYAAGATVIVGLILCYFGYKT